MVFSENYSLNLVFSVFSVFSLFLRTKNSFKKQEPSKPKVVGQFPQESLPFHFVKTSIKEHCHEKLSKMALRPFGRNHGVLIANFSRIKSQIQTKLSA